MFGRHNLKLQLIQVEYQWRIQDFPAEREPTPKTAWKWKNLDPRGIPGTPLDLSRKILQQECIPVCTRMCTICCSGRLGGCLPSGVSAQGRCLPSEGDVYPEWVMSTHGVFAQRGVSAWEGSICPGVFAQKLGCTPPCGQNSWLTLVKTLPFRNYCCGR